MRRRRWLYAAVVALVAAVVAVSVGVAWSRSELAHTTLKTAVTPPPSVAPQAASTDLQLSWRTSDKTAIGTPYWGGTVVTYSTHSVRGRSAATGAITWSYTRTDRTVCQAIQDFGVTITIFQHKGNCDQVTAVDSGTGKRKWTRTLDKDGMPVNGHPTYSVAQFTLLIVAPSVIYALDPGGGLDRWTFSQSGCRVNSAVIGTQGALISQRCDNPKCSGKKFCGRGEQLLLRDATAGRLDDDKAKGNADQIKWNLIGNAAVPASADQLISAVDTSSSELQVLDVTKGSSLGQLPLNESSGDLGSISQVSTVRAELLWIGGGTYSVENTGAKFIWKRKTDSPPTVTPADPSSGNVDLSSSSVAVAAPGGIALLDPATGKVKHTFAVPPPPTGSLVYPFGSGFVTAGSSTLVYR